MRRAVCVFVDLGMISSVAHAPHILFLADAGPVVGGGHVMRCLTLAGALSDLGAECRFMAPPPVAQILQAFGRDTIGQIGCAPDALVLWACSQPSDIIVVDHYGLGATEEAKLGQGRRLVVLEDMPGRRHACDLLLDAGLGRNVQDYSGLVPEAAVVLTGPQYALVRPEFARLRRETLERRRLGDVHGPILVALGLSDLFGLTAKVVEALLDLSLPNPIWAVVGAAAASLPRLKALASQHAQISIAVETRDMAALISQADLAIGAGGSSTWERACLGLPSLTLILADNQADLARGLEREGASLTLDARSPGFGSALAEAVLGLVGHDQALQALSLKARALCDGRGSGRVAAAVLDLCKA
jgi:UDP-2,4-diacetamido-2,4,6-trideoxy-beta-L-altropyranose hydrolase